MTATYKVIRTWANWDSVNRVTEASFDSINKAQERAEQERQALAMVSDYPPFSALIVERSEVSQ